MRRKGFAFMFFFRRKVTIFITAALSVLVVTGIIIGLVYGLRKSKYREYNNTLDKATIIYYRAVSLSSKLEL